MSTNGSKTYKIVRVKHFRETLSLTVRTHYRRRNLREEFTSLVAEFIESLQDSPDQEGSRVEPLPRNCAFRLPDDGEFRKMRWANLPGLKGSAKYGRLLYVSFRAEQLIYLFWFYTHAEYKGRPLEEEILRQLKLIDAKYKEYKAMKKARQSLEESAEA